MSRIGKKPLAIPDGVKATVKDGVITVEGKNGKLEHSIPECVTVTVEGNKIVLTEKATEGLRPREVRTIHALWGTTARNIESMLDGASKGYEKALQVVGVGYTAKIEAGKTLVLRCGLANEVKIEIPAGIKMDNPEPGNLMMAGIGQVPAVTLKFRGNNKQQIGQFAATIRRVRPPEPYKGKGIRFLGEEIKRKAGKALAAGAK